MTTPADTVRVLRERVDERRHALGLTWWQVGIQARIGAPALARLSMDVASLATRRALEEWLRRHPAPAPTTSEIQQGGNDHDDRGGHGG